MKEELSPEVQQRIRIIVEEGGYQSADEAISKALDALVKERENRAHLKRLLDEGMEGEAEEWTDKDWEDAERALEDHLQKKYTEK